MRIVFDEWNHDIPSQFHEKKNIEIFIKAFSRQLQEVQQMFADLYEKTDLDVAVGQNLDYIGTIIPLTRKEAGELAGIGATEPVISDERYRRFMKYKILRNTSECTYYDLVAGIELLWQYDNIHYKEDPEYPAMIVFETPPMSLDLTDPIEFHPNLCIRASGVGVIFKKIYGDFIKVNIGSFTTITFITVFFPRFNMPELRLDDTWTLGSIQTLSGYDGFGLVDLYPVGIDLRTMINMASKYEAGFTFLSEAKDPVKCGQEMEIRAPTVIQGKTAESITVQASAAVNTGVGDIIVDNLNYLDDDWELDGSRELNGGIYQL